jgi:hypothetical protein
MSDKYDNELIKLIKSRYPNAYYEARSLPKAYVGNDVIKGIVLGADPTYLKDNGKFEYVFGLEDKRSPFFRSILANLEDIGLSLENLYVQNLVKNYFKEETSQNSVWEECALLWLENLKRELDDRYKRDIPIFSTARKILEVIVFSEFLKDIRPHTIYSQNIVFGPEQNYFRRNVIALFRHHKYKLKDQQSYAEYIKALLTD